MQYFLMSISTSAFILLQLASTHAEAATFEGQLYSSGRCTPNTAMFKVDVEGDKAVGEWGYDAGNSARFEGTATESGFTAERTNRSGALQRIFGKKSSTGYDVIINGTRCNLVGSVKLIS